MVFRNGQPASRSDRWRVRWSLAILLGRRSAWRFCLASRSRREPARRTSTITFSVQAPGERIASHKDTDTPTTTPAGVATEVTRGAIGMRVALSLVPARNGAGAGAIEVQVGRGGAI